MDLPPFSQMSYQTGRKSNDSLAVFALWLILLGLVPSSAALKDVRHPSPVGPAPAQAFPVRGAATVTTPHVNPADQARSPIPAVVIADNHKEPHRQVGHRAHARTSPSPLATASSSVSAPSPQPVGLKVGTNLAAHRQGSVPPVTRRGICIQTHGEEILQKGEMHEVFPIVDRVNGVVSDSFVFKRATFANCHAVTVAEAADGTLVTAFFGGTKESHPDVVIYVARALREGNEDPRCRCFKWSKPVQVADGVISHSVRYPCWNPVLYQSSQGGPLLLYYKVGHSPRTWWGMVKASHDNGVTWGEAIKLPHGILGPIKNKPVLTPEGLLLAPSSVEESSSVWKAQVEYRNESAGEATWVLAHVPDARLPRPRHAIPAIQPTILRWNGANTSSGGASFMLLLRTASEEERVAESFSIDGGRHWGPVRKNLLPNPNSGIDAVTLRDGRQLLVYNHVAFQRRRFPINLAVLPASAQPPINPATGFPGALPHSGNHSGGILWGPGSAWLAAGELENEPGEFSYPAVIQASDGLVHVMYTWHRVRIRHVVVDPDQLATRPMPNGVWPDDMVGGYAARRREAGFRQNHGCLVPVANRFESMPRTRDGFCLTHSCHRAPAAATEEEPLTVEPATAQGPGGGMAESGGGASWAAGDASPATPAAGAAPKASKAGGKGGVAKAASKPSAARAASNASAGTGKGPLLPISLLAPFTGRKGKKAGRNATGASSPETHAQAEPVTPGSALAAEAVEGGAAAPEKQAHAPGYKGGESQAGPGAHR